MKLCQEYKAKLDSTLCPFVVKHSTLVYLNSFLKEKLCLRYKARIQEMTRSWSSGENLFCDINLTDIVIEKRMQPIYMAQKLFVMLVSFHKIEFPHHFLV